MGLKGEELGQKYPDENLLLMDGFDECIIGVCFRFGKDGRESFVVYDREKVIQKLVADGMSREEAEEFHYYNQDGAYVGEKTPGYVEIIE